MSESEAVDGKEGKSWEGTLDGSPGHFGRCPHCDCRLFIKLAEVNCGIFRCGAFKDGSGPIPPHSTKSLVDTMLAAKSIVGCGQPFKLVPGVVNFEKCDWI